MYVLMMPEYPFHLIERRSVAFRKDGTYTMSEKYPLTDRNEAVYYIHKFHKENPHE
jgi:hypothetical protein